jgi:hypothetical protein
VGRAEPWPLGLTDKKLRAVADASRRCRICYSISRTVSVAEHLRGREDFGDVDRVRG